MASDGSPATMSNPRARCQRRNAIVHAVPPNALPSPFVPAKAGTQAFFRALRALGPRVRGDERRKGRDQTGQIRPRSTSLHSRLHACSNKAQLNRPRFRTPMRRIFKIVWDAFASFNAHDGWAIASHIALSILMAMF